MMVLLCNEHPIFGHAMRQILLQLDRTIDLLETHSVNDMLRVIDEHPNVALILLDLDLPGNSGLQVLPRL